MAMGDKPDRKRCVARAREWFSRFLRVLRICIAVLLLPVGLFFTAHWTFSDFATDWQHRIAGPILLALSLYLFWGIWGSLDEGKR
jgi:hypothetical protein